MREKQKLVGRNTYTPMDAPQVRSSVTLSLNREETLSEQSLKTPSNNPRCGPTVRHDWTGPEGSRHKHAWTTINANNTREGKKAFKTE
ncbi:MAG: hypothetical protein ACYDCP_02150 [Thermoplasmataceae archaeon]